MRLDLADPRLMRGFAHLARYKLVTPFYISSYAFACTSRTPKYAVDEWAEYGLLWR